MKPASIAVVGASQRMSRATRVVANLQRFGYRGRIFPDQPEVHRGPRPPLLSGPRRVVQDAARAAGRDASALTAGRLVYVAVDDERGRAREVLRGFLHGYYGSRFDADQSAIFGPPREVAARLAEHVEAGVTRLMLGVPTLDIGHLQRVAAEVAPVVRAAARR